MFETFFLGHIFEFLLSMYSEPSEMTISFKRKHGMFYRQQRNNACIYISQFSVLIYCYILKIINSPPNLTRCSMHVGAALLLYSYFTRFFILIKGSYNFVVAR